MNTQTRKNPVAAILAVLIVLAISSLACSMGRIPYGSMSTTVDVTLTEDMFKDMFSVFPHRYSIHLDQTYDDVLDRVTDVEFHDGFIRVFGSRHHVEGSFDVSMSAEDDVLIVKIIEVNIPGIDLNDPIIVETNQELEYELTHLADPDADVLFKEVVVEDGTLIMKIQVNIHELEGPSLNVHVP